MDTYKSIKADLTTGAYLTVSFDKIDTGTFVGWYRENEVALNNARNSGGAVLFRGIDIAAVEDFDMVISSIAGRFLDYRNGNSPRTRLSTNVYSSTEYDADYDITLHSELSYSHHFPATIFFCCLQPAAAGGATPIADCRKILAQMDPTLVKRIKDEGIAYIRNFTSEKGLRTSWQDTFETEDRSVLEAYLAENDFEFSWLDKNRLRVVQKLPGIRKHPVTGDEVWFNQIDQFHPSHLQHEVLEILLALANDDEMDLPKYVTFGSGAKIDNGMIASIREAVDKNAVDIPWQAGDLLMADNMLVAHGRRAYKGNRKVLVAMAN